MQAVILAGGRGTRLAPYTTVLPKPLMPIGDRPILEIILYQLKQHGFTDITIAVGYLSHLLEAYFGDGSRFGITIRYSHEDQPLGTAGPLALISNSILNEPFLVMNGDVLTDLNFSSMYRQHCDENAAITIGLYLKEMRIDFGVLQVSDDRRVISYVEKPSFPYMVSMGVYVLSPKVLEFIPKGQRFDFPDLVNLLLERGEKVMGYPFQGEWLDIGRPEDYARAAERLHSLSLAEPSLPLVDCYEAPIISRVGGNGIK
ncbi:MAG: sugar phosphate nucleotidyltransferase [Anaerolineae bacterium]|nr:sugar phosphate nucleotidyltransferase [Anaerolineae bacterium]MDW8099046.1 sugar phosphate nucleotidyltransferase [Anaerolineae bacterium]